MAKFDQGGGCPCGLYRECEPGCEYAKPSLSDLIARARQHAERNQPQTDMSLVEGATHPAGGWSSWMARGFGPAMAWCDLYDAEGRPYIASASAGTPSALSRGAFLDHMVRLHGYGCLSWFRDRLHVRVKAWRVPDEGWGG